MKSQVIEGYQK